MYYYIIKTKNIVKI